jgi:hypothetical protein
MESGYFSAATLTFGARGDYNAPWGYGKRKASNKNDRIVVSSAWLAYSRYIASLLLAGDGTWAQLQSLHKLMTEGEVKLAA